MDVQEQRPMNEDTRTVCQLIKKFRETGNVKDVKRIGRPKSATSEEKALNVLLTIEETPQVSTREVTDNLEISNNFKKEKIHPYKLQLIYELNEDDFDRRMDFCEYTMERCNADENFASNIVFSNEATFMQNGTLNRHNCRYWARANPHWVQEAHTQYPQKSKCVDRHDKRTYHRPIFS
ncbi:hypothetical protein NQ318_005751 [Aromia moschata]|uniref:DUF4817 domain-containing protein n=1 Tax=Aromia moschata TaxID=1265417 RepID=A0AAV8YRZ0_9CUCU|nr:hypothetical protein NQ318_005751 [Aromia moschata]